MTAVVIGVAVALVFVALVVLVRRRLRPTDGVEQFQRQIDALSPAARRPVVDKVQQLDATDEPAAADADADPVAPADPDDDVDAGDDADPGDTAKPENT